MFSAPFGCTCCLDTPVVVDIVGDIPLMVVAGVVSIVVLVYPPLVLCLSHCWVYTVRVVLVVDARALDWSHTALQAELDPYWCASTSGRGKAARAQGVDYELVSEVGLGQEQLGGVMAGRLVCAVHAKDADPLWI